MLWTQTTRFRTICRIVLCLFVFQSLHPATWRVPWKLDISFDTWPLNFGPTLAYGQSSDPNLAATPDANKDDPFIIQKAQELGNNPVSIFNFVRDEIGYESYKGSLRGARGTLWSKAGNALDQASLLIALLRASNIPARYVRGTLPDNLAQQLILSMFPPPLRVLGCLDSDIEVADPANDAKLLGETREHYWVEFGAGFQAADPAFANAQIGQTFTSSQGTFTEVPDALRHKVTVRLNRELTLPGAGLLTGGSSQDIATVLDETFNTVGLVGRSLSIGHFVTSAELSTVFTFVTHNYTPYVVINQRDGNVLDDPLFRSGDYQEVLTSFPFGSQILTGLFLEAILRFPDGRIETVEKTLFDRIGFTQRQQGGSAESVSVDPASGPALTNLDIVTLEITASKQSEQPLVILQDTVDQVAMALDALPLGTGSLTAQQSEQALKLFEQLALELTSAIGGRFLVESAAFTDVWVDFIRTRSYFDSPRIVAVSYHFQEDPSTLTTGTSFAVDILRNEPRSHAAAGQAQIAANALRFIKGLGDKIVEQGLLPPGQSASVTTSVGSFDLFLQALATPGVNVIAIDQTNLTELSSLNLPAEATARISQSVLNGRIAIVPSATVTIDGKARLAWIEVDPLSSNATAVLDDGTHSLSSATGAWGASSRVTLQSLLRLINAHGVDDLQLALKVLAELKKLQSFKEQTELLSQLTRTWRIVSGFPALRTRLVQIVEDIANGKASIDPAVGTILLSPGAPSPEFATLGSGMNSGVAAAIVQDPLFTVPTAGAQVPTVFKVGFKNLTGATDIFTIDVSNVPPGFSADQSVASIEVPPGETGEISICLRPAGGVPAPGTPASFDLTVTSATNPAITASDTENFTVPDIHGVTLSSNPPTVNTTPGAPVDVELTIKSVGNVAENVTFNLNLPPNLNADGGLNPVALGIGESTTRTLTLTPSANTPLNSTLTAQITANFSALEPQTLLLRVRVAVPGADAIADASVAAGQLGNDALANRLNDLSIALTNLVQNPSSDIFKSQALGALDSILSQLANDPNFSSFVSDLTAARNALAAANTASAIQTAVNSLGNTLDAFATGASDLAQHNFEAFLLPNSQVAQPQTPAVFELRLHNIGTDTTTYNISLGALPSGVTGQLSQASVTLDRDELAAVNVTLTQTATTELLAFNFPVTVSAAEAPSVSRTVQGALTVRNDFISVVEVSADPPFTDPGDQVNVSARLLNGVNQQRQALVSYIVKNPNGQTVFTSQPVQTTLTVQTSLVTLALGALNTTGFTLGQHSIVVTVTDLNSTPIPGATGEGSLLIGSPVTATISVDPDTLPPGDGMVTNRLQVSTIANVGDPLTVVGHLPIDQFKQVFEPNINDFLNGLALNLAQDRLYVLGNNGFHVVNVADPTQPLYVRNKAFQGFTSGIVDGNRLIVMGPGPITNVAVNARGVLDYIDLGGTFGTADDPGRIQGTNFPYQFAGVGVLVNTHMFVPTLQTRFNPANNDIFSQNGTVLSFSVDPARVSTTGIFALEDALLNENGTTNDATLFENGGNFNMFNVVVASPQTLLVASTTSTGTNTQTGVGRILVVDMSDPNNINSDPPNTSKIVGELQIPGTVHVHGLARDGNLAFAVASQGGWLDPFVDVSDIGPTGNLVLATLDITDPRSPQHIHSAVIPRSARGGGDNLIALGNHRFAFSSLGQFNQADTPQLFVVDASNLDDIVIIAQLDVPGGIRGLKTDGTFLYATGDDGLTIYRLGAGNVSVTTQVQIPNNTGVAVVPNSFSIPPTSSISGTDFDTLVWEFTGSQTVTWQSTITNLQPGEAREATLETTVDFTFQGTPGQITLPPTFVTSQHILAMDPSTRTVPPGEVASYTLTVKNPTAGAVTYALSVQGIPLAWVALAPSITVPANNETNVALTLTSDPFAALAEYGFVVTASTNTGTTGSVQGSLLLQGTPVLPSADPVARGVVVSLTPAQATAGQGTPAHFVLRLTNTGSATDTFTLTAGVPTGVTGTLEVTSVEVPPGASNFRDVSLTLTPQPGSATGNRPFTVTATSAIQTTVHDTANGTVTVVGNGVDVALTPTSGPPSSTYQLRVTNTGQGQDTFDLAAGGPGGLVATLGTNAVTLASGASQNVPLTVGAINFAYTGNLTLVGIATSRGNLAVQDSATATVTIAATQSITARFDPASVTLPIPGAAAFLLLVDNTGNTEDAYTAAITGITGPITASLNGLDGQPTQTIPLFRLPGLSRGALVLDTTLTAAGQGMVTVRITSQTNAAITASATATVQTPGGGNLAPVAHAGLDQTLPLGETVLLDGRASTDQDNPPAALHFQWSIAARPPGSALTNAQISDATTAQAAFTPDVIGDYTLRLTVSDGALSAADEVLIHVQNTPPVAEAGPDRTAKTGMEVTLNGSDSFDPNGDLITYDWTLVEQPAGSALTSQSLTGRQTPKPTFTPDRRGRYVFELIVNDGLLDSEPDTVAITASPSNVPPNADAGPDQYARVRTAVVLDGSASHDPDQSPRPLTYQWTFKPPVPPGSTLQNAHIQTATQAQASFVPDMAGTYALNLWVSDGSASGNDEVVITASASNVPPNADASEDQTVTPGAEVVLEGLGSHDPDDGPAALSYTWRFVSLPHGSIRTNADIVDADLATARFTPDVAGSYVVRLEVFDGEASSFDNVLITATPCIERVTASPNVLWPPNHKMVPVTVGVSVSTRCPAAPVCQISSVRSNEPVNGLGDGDTAPDWEFTGALTVRLRAERAGQGSGRVYTITVSCTAGAGHNETGTTTVQVPHDQGKK